MSLILARCSHALLAVLILSAPSTALAHDDSWDFVWAHQPTTDSYQPTATYAHNEHGGLTQIEREDTGRYSIAWRGSYPSNIWQNRSMLVTAYGGTTHYCNAANSGQAGSYAVECFDSAGNFSDTNFAASLTGAQSHPNPFVFVTANQPTNPSYSATGFLANGSFDVPVTRSSTGVYQISFPGFDATGTGGGNVQVSALNSNDRCTVAEWHSEEASVHCFDPVGSPADSEFSLVFTRAESDTEGIAYAWASNPTQASYTPSATYSYNPTGGAITATRTGTGQYTLTWSGMADISDSGGNVNVTAYSAVDHRCKVGAWGSDFVNVDCFDSAGNPVDTRYTVIYRKPVMKLWTRWFGAAVGSSPLSAQYTPLKYWNAVSMHPTLGGVEITRIGLGSYVVEFRGLGEAGDGGGNVQVTSMESTGEYCNVVSWWAGSTAEVRCYSATGDAADAHFSIVMLKPHDDNTQLAYAWLAAPSAPLHTPPTDYSHNPAGGSVTIDRFGPGHHRVTFAGMSGVGANPGMPIVTAYGATTNRCQVSGWSGDYVDVWCTNVGGTPTDSQFSLLVLKPDENANGLAYAYADLPNTSSYAPLASRSYNPAVEPITASRATVGEYTMQWEGFDEYGLDSPFTAGFPLATSVGVSAEHCSVPYPHFDDVDVFCRDDAGLRTSVNYNVAVIRPVSVPEPATWMGLTAGFTALGLMSRSRRPARALDGPARGSARSSAAR